MKSIGSINSILLLIVVMALNGCKKKENDRGAGASYFKDACISVDKTGAKKGETITVSNCGVYSQQTALRLKLHGEMAKEHQDKPDHINTQAQALILLNFLSGSTLSQSLFRMHQRSKKQL